MGEHRKSVLYLVYHWLMRYYASLNTDSGISQHQAVYFAETGLYSAINGPSMGEIFLTSELERFYNALNSEPIEHLFVEPEKFPEAFQRLSRRYKVKAESSYGMIYMTPN